MKKLVMIVLTCMLAIALAYTYTGCDKKKKKVAVATWTNVSPVGTSAIDYPSARDRHTMAYDSTKGVVVLFGGYDDITLTCSDTWEWDGDNWTDVSPSGTAGVDFPYGRVEAALAFDSTRNVAVLFGGDNADYVCDTWEWDGGNWSNVSPSGTEGVDYPPARSNHAMAFDPVRGVVVLFGGDNDDYLGDTWEWDGDNWSNVSPSGTAGTDFPTARCNHAMAFDSSANAVVLYGGYYGFVDSEVWQWDGTTWTDVSPGGVEGVDYPPTRRRHSVAYDSIRGVLVIFGGDDGALRYDDTWEWNGSSWTETATTGTAGVDYPAGRGFTGMGYDSGRGVVVLFGGYVTATYWSDETWEYGAP